MTTLAQLADRAQAQLSDSVGATWNQVQIEEWVIEGVRAYSRYFPRLRYGQAIVSTGVHEVYLPADFMSIVSVEYPEGETPPRYLNRRHHQEADFWEGRYYDIIERQDNVTVSEIWLGPSPTVGEYIGLQYHAYHVISTTGTIVQTIPPQHEDILVQYVYWKAKAELVAAEAADPTSNSSLLMAQLDQIAGAAFRRYGDLMRQALGARLGESVIRAWSMDTPATLDRIY